MAKKLISPFMEEIIKKKENAKSKDKTDDGEKNCGNCKHSYLMRSAPVNPVVSHCMKHNIRNVATSPIPKKCGYERNLNTPIIHPMIFVKDFVIEDVLKTIK